jgi:hypothetical protein
MLVHPSYILTGLTRQLNRSNHHSSNRAVRNLAEMGRVNVGDLADVFSEYVDASADCDWVDCVILAVDGFGAGERAVDGNVESVVVLRRESEYCALPRY